MPGDLLKNLDRLAAQYDAAAAEGLEAAGDHVLEVSNRDVPFEKGTLRASGKVSVDREALRVAVSYDTDYAVMQHEDPDNQHDAGRSPKYLENAINSERTEAAQIVAETVRRRLGT